jgi:hypothetical protein
VTRVCSQTLAVGGPPRANNLILGGREEEIAILVELDLGQGPFLERRRTATVSFFEDPNGAEIARTWPDNRIGRILDGATDVFEPKERASRWIGVGGRGSKEAGIPEGVNLVNLTFFD